MLLSSSLVLAKNLGEPSSELCMEKQPIMGAASCKSAKGDDFSCSQMHLNMGLTMYIAKMNCFKNTFHLHQNAVVFKNIHRFVEND